MNCHYSSTLKPNVKDPVIEPKADNRRRYPRLKAPKSLWIAWQAAGERKISRADTIGLGGIFLYTDKPSTKGSMIDLMIDIGADGVRDRAVVRHVTAGKGMGLQFVQMRAEDRARLNQFLKSQQACQDQKASRPASPRRPPQAESPSAKGTTAPADTTTQDMRFEQEIKTLLQFAQNGTYYQLLGVTPDAPKRKLKESFYALARKYHPDHHMGSNHLESLQELMEIVTAAYKTLGNEQAKATYDKKLAATGAFSLDRGRSEAEETVEGCLAHATECLNAKNFVGSIVWLRKCVAMAPESGKYHALLAHSLATVAGYRHEAIEHFQTAIELDPWNPAAYFHFAELYERMALPWRARPLYSKILEIDPEHAKARERIASLDSSKDKNSPRRSASPKRN